jgi:ATP-dependent DNA helicase DinG
LPEAEQLLLQSPFDYARNSLLYLPPELPAPGAPQFDDRAVDAMWPLLDASDGGAFVLCTSYRAVSIWAQRLRERFGDRLLVQGSSGRADLLARFRADGNAVLVGTSSFWEGVDVRGPALRLVIIDRLPFASPSDPVLNARIEAIRDEGGSPFKSLQLPQAVIAFKQGVGRLIRDASDRGVLAVCDPRLRTKGYGRTFLKSLPPLPVTSILADATDFLKRLDEAP